MKARLRFLPWLILTSIFFGGMIVIPHVVTSMTFPQVRRLLVKPRQHPHRDRIFTSTPATKVPILMYHYIRTCDDPEDINCPALSVPPTTFAQQLTWLYDHGYTTVDLDYFSRPYETHGKPIVITFDDGYDDTFTAALPLLEAQGFTATFYVITDRVGLDGYLTWSQIQSMRRRGMVIGSHSENHADMTKVDDVALRNETENSKRILETEVGPVDDFCYPFGIYNQHVEQAVRDSGYTTATTTHEGIATYLLNHWQLPRVRMKERTVLETALQATSSTPALDAAG